MKVILANGAEHIVPSDNAADLIARNLQTFGYPDVTAVTVREQLAKPADERDIIGMFAYGMLEENDLIPVED